MFDFENLNVYTEARNLSRTILHYLVHRHGIDLWVKDQLKRASISVMINIAEGSGKFTRASRRNHFIIARGSLYECVSLLNVLQDLRTLTDQEYGELYKKCEQVSKMLLRLIRSFE